MINLVKLIVPLSVCWAHRHTCINKHTHRETHTQTHTSGDGKLSKQ